MAMFSFKLFWKHKYQEKNSCGIENLKSVLSNFIVNYEI